MVSTAATSLHCKCRKCQITSLSIENNFEVIKAYFTLTLVFHFWVGCCLSSKCQHKLILEDTKIFLTWWSGKKLRRMWWKGSIFILLVSWTFLTDGNKSSLKGCHQLTSVLDNSYNILVSMWLTVSVDIIFWSAPTFYPFWGPKDLCLFQV